MVKCDKIFLIFFSFRKKNWKCIFFYSTFRKLLRSPVFCRFSSQAIPGLFTGCRRKKRRKKVVRAVVRSFSLFCFLFVFFFVLLSLYL